jgi:phosphoglycolate phosphatase-like HAD superfamily hydrolase
MEDVGNAPNETVAVLFDVDGTLISSGGAGAAAWRLAFERLYGIPADIGKYADSGITDPEVGRLTFTNVVGHEPSRRELSRVLSARLHYLPQTVAESEGYRVLPGVRKTLDELQEAGYLLGLTTGGIEAVAHIKLARGDLNHYFSFGGYGSDSPDRVELTRRAIERAANVLGEPLDPGEALVVGDTPHDVDAAHGAGARVVAVATGHFRVDALRDAGADYVLESLEEQLPVEDGLGSAELERRHPEHPL